MKVSPLADFVCPMDDLPLAKIGSSLRCGRGHTFDYSREGYCNLLLVQQKASRDPGDSKAMVAARSSFLRAGHYFPIAKKLFDVIQSEVDRPSVRIVDAGCGEGYYSQQVREMALIHPNPSRLELAGFDISKWAVQAAAKNSSRDIAWLVASNRQMPFAKGSIDIILSLFGFPMWESFKTALTPNRGLVLLVDPGVNHLIELRKIIYPTVNITEPPSLKEAFAAGYRLKREERLTFVLNLESPKEIRDLLAMTPHAHRISATGAEALAAHERLTLTADVMFRLLQLGR